MPKTHKVAMLTAGGLAPCLSSAVGGLIERYTAEVPEAEIIGYHGGYAGLLRGRSLPVTPEVRARAAVLHKHGGTPLGNSRVKLTNIADCVKRGLVKEGEVPLEVAAKQLARDGITILHTIGGDDTNTTAADLANALAGSGYDLTVVGLPKTVDNDVVPIRQSMGAATAAEQGAIFFENIANEQSTSARMLIVHEVMGRNCGWLTAATARVYRERLGRLEFLPAFNLDRARKDIDAVYLPELPIDIGAEAERLRRVMDAKDSAILFVSEGANLEAIVADMESQGERLERDAFGHVRLDTLNAGDWFAKRIGRLIGAEKILVQKSGYFARSAAANAEDSRLIGSMVEVAVASALNGTSGVVGHDEGNGGVLRAIEFARIKGGKRFDVSATWFEALARDIGQPLGGKVLADHGP